MVTVATTSKSGLTLFIEKIPIFPYTLGKRIVFFSLPEAFSGLKYAENAIAAGAPSRTPLGELTTLPRPSSRLGSGHPSPYPAPLGAFAASMLAPSAPRSSCSPDTKSWRRRWSPPLVLNCPFRLGISIPVRYRWFRSPPHMSTAQTGSSAVHPGLPS